MSDENDEEIDDTNEDGLDDVLDGGAEGDKSKPKPESTDDLKAAMLELTGIVKKQSEPKVEPKKELSQDEKDELWGVYRPEKKDPKFLDKFFRLTEDMTPEQRGEFKALFDDFQSGMMRQAITGSKNLLSIELAKLREEFQPAQEFISKQKAETTRNAFYSKYPTLGEKTEAGGLRYERIINATARTLADKEFDSETSYFKALAEGAAESIKAVLPEFDLGAVTTKKPAGTSPRLPRTRVGGTGGTGNGTFQALAVKGDATDEFLQDS